MRRHKMVWYVFLLMLAASPVAARDIRQGDQCRITVDEVIVGDLFVLCRTLEIEGEVQGNLIGAATTATIAGRINGSLYLLAGQLIVNGVVADSVHFVGPILELGANTRLSNANGDVLALSLGTTIERGAQIPDALIAAGYQLTIEGNVGGDTHFWGNALRVAGAIEGDIDASVGDSQSLGVAEVQALLTVLPFNVDLERPGLRVDQDAEIQGQLRYSAPSEGIINSPLAEPAQFTMVSPQPDLAQIAAIAEEPEDAGRELILFGNRILSEFITLGIIGLFLLRFVPSIMPSLTRTLSFRVVPNLGVGFTAAFLSVPVWLLSLFVGGLILWLVLMLRLSELSLVAAVLLSAFNLVLGILFYVVIVFVSRLVMCMWIGRWLLRRFSRTVGGRSAPYIQLLLGTAILAFLSALPTIGWWLSLLLAFAGLGWLIANGQSVLQFAPIMAGRRVESPRILPTGSQEARQYPPPLLRDGTAPGMDNLPSGFRWWDES
jgi:cytoskeletal protein CcmA (bactofilin family)